MLKQAVDDRLDDAFHHRVGHGAGMQVVVQAVLFLHGETVVGYQGGPVVAPAVAIGDGEILQHPVQFDDVRSLVLRVEPGVFVVVRGDRAKDGRWYRP